MSAPAEREGDLMMAVRAGDATKVRKLLQENPSRVDERPHKHRYHYKDNATPLCNAADLGDVATINVLLDYNADTTIKAWWGHTPLMRACERGHVEAARALLKHSTNKADPNLVGGSNDGTALYNAIVSGNIDLVTLLLDCNANINHKDKVCIVHLSNETFVKKTEISFTPR